VTFVSKATVTDFGHEARIEIDQIKVPAQTKIFEF